MRRLQERDRSSVSSGLVRTEQLSRSCESIKRISLYATAKRWTPLLTLRAWALCPPIPPNRSDFTGVVRGFFGEFVHDWKRWGV